MTTVFIILAITIGLFLSDRLRLDLVALLSLLALILTGSITVREGLAGFADPVVILIAGLFVVGAALFQTGVAAALGRSLGRLAGTNEARLIAIVMIVVALLSAFLSSTGTVAIFLPVVVSLAAAAKLSPARLLIPMAYASLIGGMLTLIGTPPNIVASEQLAQAQGSGFSFFAFTPIGLIMLVVGIAFMVLLGPRLLPDRRSAQTSANNSAHPGLKDLLASYSQPGRVMRLRIRVGSPLADQTLATSRLRSRYGIHVLEIQPWPYDRSQPSPARPAVGDQVFAIGDLLLVQGSDEAIDNFIRDEQLSIEKPEKRYAPSRELAVVEVQLTPRSRFVGETLEKARVREAYGINVLGMQRMGQPFTGDLVTTPLAFGDTLLITGARRNLEPLMREQHYFGDFVVVGQPRELIEQTPIDTQRAPIAIMIMVAMLGLMTFEVVDNVVAVLLAAVGMVLSGCVKIEDVYRRMSWESVILIACMLPMATALRNTGGIDLIANGLVNGLGAFGPLALMAGLFLLTSLFSQFISNTATAVLIAPIAVQAALGLGVAIEPMLMAVALAASTSFATPIASPVNTLVLGPGNYRFGDFARVGIPLQLVLMIVTLLVVPWFFPL